LSTTWYVVVECKRSNHILPYNDYKGIAVMTTNRQEALDKEKEIDSKENTVGIVESLEVMNA
jgi:hypothetical protein